MPGAFITFEGIEGSGKSTQIALLAEGLRAAGVPIALTREPGGTAIGDQVRRILLDPANTALDPVAELLLYGASRAQHLAELIGPQLSRGAVVLCDRFADATLAYQGFGRGVALPVIRDLDRIVCAGLKPDLTLLVDCEAAAGLSRARGRNDTRGLAGEGRFENEELAFHERVREGYRTLAREEPGRFAVVSAERPVAEVQREIREIVAARLETKI